MLYNRQLLVTGDSRRQPGRQRGQRQPTQQGQGLEVHESLSRLLERTGAESTDPWKEISSLRPLTLSEAPEGDARVRPHDGGSSYDPALTRFVRPSSDNWALVVNGKTKWSGLEGRRRGNSGPELDRISKGARASYPSSANA